MIISLFRQIFSYHFVVSFESNLFFRYRSVNFSLWYYVIFFLDKVLFGQVLNSYWFLQIYLFIPQPPISKSRYVEELKVLKEIAFSIYNDIHFHFEKLDPYTSVLCQDKTRAFGARWCRCFRWTPKGERWFLVAHVCRHSSSQFGNDTFSSKIWKITYLL